MNSNVEGQDGRSMAFAQLEDITKLLATPSGFSKLSPEQRKFALAVVLGSVIPADGKVRPCEMEKLEAILRGRMQTRGQTLQQVLLIAKSPDAYSKQIAIASMRLADLLGIEDRCALIGMLWDIALCDHELHAREETLIYDIADKAGVPRKKVAEQQAKSAANVT